MCSNKESLKIYTGNSLYIFLVIVELSTKLPLDLLVMIELSIKTPSRSFSDIKLSYVMLAMS